MHSIAYLASSLAAMMSRSNGGQKAISVLLVIGILILYSVITRALPKLSNDSTVLVVREFIASIPTLIFSVVVTVGCTLGTGYLVNRKISLWKTA